MPDDVGRERAQMEAAVEELRAVLDPIFERSGVGYAVIAFSKLPPGFARFATNVERERLAEVLLEMGGRLKADDLMPEPGERSEL